MNSSNNSMNYGLYEIIEGTANHYQSNFNISTIVAYSSDYDDVFNNDIKAKRISGDDKLLCSSNMRATAKEHQPKDSSVMKMFIRINERRKHTSNGRE